MSLVGDPNLCAVFSINPHTKLIVDTKGLAGKVAQIKENPLYRMYVHMLASACM
jgi:hypothetical protein